MRIATMIFLLVLCLGFLLLFYQLGYKVGQKQVILKSIENMEVKDENVADGFHSLTDRKL